VGLDYLPWNFSAEQLDRPCLSDDASSLTGAEVAARTDAIAAQFAACGIGPGDVVAVMLPNRVELVLTIFAAWRLGAVATPVNPSFTATEAGYQLADSGAKLLVNAGPGAPHAGVAPLHVDDLAVTAPDSTSVPAPAHDTSRLDDVALLIYTSGSTGRPKGVMLSHRNADAMTAQMVRHFELTADDHCLLILPLFHVNAIMVSVLSPLRAGGRTTFMGRFAPEPFLALLERIRPTYFSAVPAIYALLAALPVEVLPDTSSLRFAVCGAAPVSEELLRQSEERFGFVMVEGYGLTEGTCASACNPIRGVRRLGTVGPALDGQQLAIISPDGERLPPGAEGEVVIAGPTVMQGYLGKPDATAETIRDGWLHTGDVGRLDADGYLTLVDRIKDMIIRGGENLYPKEIETVLHQVDGVLEAAVVGRPDPVMGEVPVAFVTRYPGNTTTVEDLLAHAREHLTRVKVPVEVIFVDEIPKNPVGKIDKPTLRRRLTAQLASAG
jgi:long-chain acyl-CoA synthetase